MQKIHVLVVEDEGLYRDMLVIALKSTPGLEVVGAASDGQAALAAATELRPDVVITDIDLGSPPNGIELGRQIRKRLPGCGILLLSNHTYRQYLQMIPVAEAAGWSYLLKKSVATVATLVRAVQGVAMGLMVLDPALNEGFHPHSGSRLSRLTARQLQVLRLMSEGHTNAAIAERLSISTKSVENYLTAIYQELCIWQDGSSVHPRVKAVLVYLRETGKYAAEAAQPSG